MAALDRTAPSRAPGRAAVGPAGWLALGAVLLVALGLRGPVSSVGPVLDELRDGAGLGGVGVALLPALPLLCWGLLSPTAPALARRLGLHRAVLAGSVLLVLGLALRSSAGRPGLFVGTVVLSAGIALVNVLLPAVLKADFPHRLALATSLCTSAIALSASLGAGLAQPLLRAAGGPLAGLALWVAPALVGAAVWLPLALRRPPSPGTGRATGLPVLLRDRVALAVTAFFGLQALAFYTLLAWLPSVLRDAGVPAASAGSMLAVAALLGAPAALVVPRWATGRRDQGRCVLAVAAPLAAGLLGLLLAPGAAPWLWSLLVGAGTGAAFPLALALVVLRSRDSAQAARLSAVAQGVGYALAALGPVLVGVLHERTGSWTAPLLVLLALLAVQVAVGLQAGRDPLARR